MRTALITGASAGIGAAFARRLGKDGHALVLVARDEGRLAAFADELAKEHGVPVEVLPADLATDAGIAAVEARLTDAERPVDLLVNNAGFGFRKGFLDVPVEDELTMVKVHIEAVLRLTRAAVPGMRERGKGYVVNVASVAAFVPRGSYGASKSWVVQFTAGVNRDLVGSGVTLQALCPGFTHTEFHQRAEMDMSGVGEWMWLDADYVVDQSLRDLVRGKSICVPSRRYQALVALSRKAPLALLGGMSSGFGRRPTEK
ncbi:SDR family NAD(P)-dependent oxidoreductase [Streptacidiphilus anmyonensis]|uniref:SDR family NAD(P)-dependent oxidoreductase n=1 Tax=Streptacidiphilus anmyonensis TaxID=405782 RepID=UPI0005A5EDB9|nr:SDR family oxidoreductase [Streptacidiphilus anmyonensis]